MITLDYSLIYRTFYLKIANQTRLNRETILLLLQMGTALLRGFLLLDYYMKKKNKEKHTECKYWNKYK